MQLINVMHEHLIEELLILTVFWLVLVKAQLSHPLLCSLSLLRRQFLFTFFFFFLCSLNGFEFIKHVLVVQNSMREFISKIVFRQKFLDTLSNYRISEDGVNIWPLFWVHIQHSL